jgi:hypothetical protein
MPNRNAYLAVELSDDCIKAIRWMQQQLLVELGTAFDPQPDAHMTFFFCGEELHRLPASDVTAWLAALAGTLSHASPVELSLRSSRCGNHT